MTGGIQLDLDLALDGPLIVVGNRDPLDYYRTPEWLVEAALAVMPAAWWLTRPPRTVLDAGAGDGVLAAAVERAAPGPVEVVAVELDPGRCARLREEHPAWRVVEGDLLAWAAAGVSLCPFDFVIANPPFCAWDAWVDALLRLRHRDGVALVLGFMNHLGGQRRAAWWRAHWPSAVWLSPRRASFTADGKTDPRDAAWYVWAGARHDGALCLLPTERIVRRSGCPTTER